MPKAMGSSLFKSLPFSATVYSPHVSNPTTTSPFSTSALPDATTRPTPYVSIAWHTRATRDVHDYIDTELLRCKLIVHFDSFGCLALTIPQCSNFLKNYIRFTRIFHVSIYYCGSNTTNK